MANCKHRINIDGTYQEFNSDEELNSFLRKHKRDLVSSLLSPKVLFSKGKSDQDLADDRLVAMHSNVVKNDYAHEYLVDGVNYEPTTKWITKSKGVDGNPLVRGFDLEEFMNKKQTMLLQELNGDGTQRYTPDEAKAITTNLKNNYETQKLLGTSWHKVAEAFFQGKVNNTDDIVKIVPEMKGMTYALNKYITALSNLRGQLQGKHGGDAIFRTEMMIYDKDKKLAGTIDLAVIDNKGIVHIYDYKTATKDENLWVKQKLQSIDYQLATYRQMLRRAGLNVGTVSYIPVELRDVDFKNKVVGDFEMRQPNNLTLDEKSTQMMNIKALLPYTMQLRVSDISSNNDVKDFLREAFNWEAKEIKVDPATVDAEFDKLKTNMSANGRSYVYWNQVTREPIFIPISLSDSDIKSRLSSYVEQYNEYQHRLPSRFYDFVQYAKHQQELGEPISWETRWSNDPMTVTKISRLLDKYINSPDWKPLQSDALYDLNMIAFENTATNEVDLITLSAANLEKSPKLLADNGKAQTLLGNFLPDGKALFNRIPDKLTNGDVELLKVYAFIKNNQEIFGDKTIGSLYAVNMYKNNIVPRIYPQTLETLDKWYSLVMKHIPTNLKLKGKDWEIKGIDQTEHFIRELKGLFDTKTFNVIGQKNLRNGFDNLVIATEKEEKIELLDKLSQNLQKTLNFDMNTGVHTNPEIANLVYIASQAIAQLSELPTINEQDMKNIGNGLEENRSLTSPTNVAKQQAFITIRQLTTDSLNNTAHAFNVFKEQIRKLHGDFYKSKNAFVKVKVIGQNLSLFDNLFEVVDGVRTMRFKDPDKDPTLLQAERDYIKGYMDITQKIRAQKLKMEGREDEHPILPELARNIPLMRASQLTSLLGGDYKQYFANMFRNVLNPQNIYKNDVKSEELLKTQAQMYNFFDRYDMDPNARAEKLGESDPKEFETDLEAVLDTFTMLHTKEQETNKQLPKINAIKMLTLLSGHYMFNDNSVTSKMMQDYLGTVLFDKNLVADESPGLAKFTEVVKKITSVASIGLSPISGLTDLMTGVWANISRGLANSLDPKMFGIKDLMSAGKLLFGDLATNKMSLENVNLCDSINEMFRVSEMDIKQMTHQVQMSNAGLAHFNSHYLYWFNTFPTYMNRMAMFMAQMIKDGTIKLDAVGGLTKDSAIQMINGKMVYNDKLDPRYKEYLSAPNLEESRQTANWKEQRAIYLKMQESLGAEPGGLKADGSLARPYDNKQRDSMKQFSDDAHGNYDGETKTAFEKTAFGKIFMHFKTYLTSKKNKWYTPTAPSQIKGSYEIEYLNGEPIPMWKGRVTEGIWQSIMAISNEVKNNGGNIIKSWNNLHISQKQNFALMFADILQFGIYALLLSAIDMKDLKKNSPMQAEIFRGITNSTQDLWIGSSIGTFAGDKNPIAIMSWGDRVLTTSWGAITGKPHAARDLANNVGVFRTINKAAGLMSGN